MRTELVLFGARISMSSRRRRRTLVVLIYVALSAVLASVARWAPWSMTNVCLFLLTVFLVNRFAFGGLSTRGLVRPLSSAIRPLWFSDDPPPSSAIDRWFWRRSPSRKDLKTDEREDRRRDRAVFLAYGVLSYSTYVVYALFAMVRIGHFLGTKGLPFDFALGAAFAVAILSMTLPQAILLWTEPDMEEADAR